MPASNLSMIHKLQQAINMHGGSLLMDRIQFFSQEQKRPITMYRVCAVVGVTKSGKRKKECLFETASQLQIVLFLRDYWFVMNGKELPAAVNNKKWEEIRAVHMDGFESAKKLYEENQRKEEKS